MIGWLAGLQSSLTHNMQMSVMSETNVKGETAMYLQGPSHCCRQEHRVFSQPRVKKRDVKYIPSL